jgi:hypothetical protein
MESFRVGESSWPEITFLGPYVSSPMPELTIVFKRNLYSCSPRFLFLRTILAQVSVSSFLSYIWSFVAFISHHIAAGFSLLKNQLTKAENNEEEKAKYHDRLHWEEEISFKC